MNNQYAVLISSEIPELGELDLLRSICRELNGYMEDYNNQINLDNLGAVSYTHLDVYKRQA